MQERQYSELEERAILRGRPLPFGAIVDDGQEEYSYREPEIALPLGLRDEMNIIVDSGELGRAWRPIPSGWGRLGKKAIR